MFIKEKKDRQEEHLKLFYMPGQPDFGLDRPEDYGTLTYVDEKGIYHEEKVISEQGDYARIYDALKQAYFASDRKADQGRRDTDVDGNPGNRHQTTKRRRIKR